MLEATFSENVCVSGWMIVSVKFYPFKPAQNLCYHWPIEARVLMQRQSIKGLKHFDSIISFVEHSTSNKHSYLFWKNMKVKKPLHVTKKAVLF